MRRILLLVLALVLFSCGGRLPNGESVAAYQAAILSPSQDAVLIFDLLTHRVSHKLPTGAYPQDLALGNGGQIFVSNAQESSISVFQRQDPRTWYRIGTVGLPALASRLTWSDQHSELYVLAAHRPLLFVFRMPSQQRPVLEQSLRLSEKLGQPTALALSDDGETLYVAGSGLQSLQRQNERWQSGQELELPEFANISDLVQADQELFLADQAHDQVLTVNLKDWQMGSSIELGTDLDSAVLPTRMALNHAGSKIYLTGMGASVVQILDVAKAELLQTLDLKAENPPAAAPLGLAITADDRQVYVTAQSGRNLVILESSPELTEPDRIMRTLGTTASEALLPPLGMIRIF